jgi:2,3-bisphosphoglycerate-independent phosphoglycerate mutase
MKYILLIPDGAADEPFEELGGKTPLEAAKTPNLDFLAKHGRVGLFNPIPPKMEAGSDIGHLSIFGYDPRKCYTGRAPLEAANLGVQLEKDEVAFRMNLVTESDGILIDHSAGAITTREAHALVRFLSSKLSSEYVKFYPGVSYRHVAVFKDARGLKGLSAETTPPHDILGEPWNHYLPKGEGDAFLKKLIFDSKPLLENHEINQVRIDLGENPANLIWFWGQGVSPVLESFEKRFGLRGSVVSAVDLVNGIGRLIGFEVLKVPGVTGTVETNFEGKVQAALDSLESGDLAVIHIEAIDEATHSGNMMLKILALEHFDQKVAGPVRKYMEKVRDTRLLVAVDHHASLKTRTHESGEVPFLVYGAGILPSGASRYTEGEARLGQLRVKEGHRLMEAFLQGQV